MFHPMDNVFDHLRCRLFRLIEDQLEDASHFVLAVCSLDSDYGALNVTYKELACMVQFL